MILDFLKWVGLVMVLGWIAFPITFHFLPKLRDRGYAVSKALGILLWGFFYWILVILHLLPNQQGAMCIVLFILFLFSLWIGFKRGWEPIWEWVKGHWRTVLVVEILFLVAFGFFAWIRASSPDILYTEKPMELAFVNSIIRAPSFPPNHPWLSGYAISYYYFGYVLIAILCQVTKVASEIGYNLAIGLWFALCAVGAYGILYNLLSRSKTDRDSKEKQGRFSALFGPLFVLLVSNIEAFLEMLHSKGIFWIQTPTGEWQSSFWKWLNIPDLVNPPSQPFTWLPRGLNGWWWWRASRLWQDFDILKARGPLEVIHEFPAFSFFLGDLHPHVLALPFVMLAIAVALNLYHTFQGWRMKGFRIFDWMRTLDFWLIVILFGAFGFLNTWNFPIYIAIVSAVFALTRYEQMGWHWRRLWDFLRFAAILGFIGLIVYLPFYLSFSSQAGGFLPSLDFFTDGKYFWIHFLPLLVPIFIWLVWQTRQHWKEIHFWNGLKFSAIIVFGIWVLSYLLGALLGLAAPLGSLMSQANSSIINSLGIRLSSLAQGYLGIHGGADPVTLLVGSFSQRIISPFTWLTIFFLLWLVWSLFSLSQKPSEKIELLRMDSEQEENRSSNKFVLLLVLLGGGLTLFPEFFFLRDGFIDRMNTIFKFYFETWILWGLAAAFAVVSLLRSLRKGKQIIFEIVLVILLAISLLYPIFFTATLTNDFKPVKLTLDGLSYMEQYSPDDYAAIQFLKTAPYGNIVEAVGGSYSYSNGIDYERISTHTGLPTVLGWIGHELQWRGGTEEMGNRDSDIKVLYSTSDWQEALAIIQKYQIRYIYIGAIERSTLKINLEKFSVDLPNIFHNQTVDIFEVPSTFLEINNP